jgi:formate hydrogenlyase transcriptional activator
MTNAQLIGTSREFRTMLSNIGVVAPVDSAVLIQGETGTGKELVARTIHETSPRRQNRFMALNCAAIPGALLESELFGYERGAFTGAVAQNAGRFQAANRGTLFLDEIGDLPLELQPKLLRALQEKEIERLGSNRGIPVDVRVIAATNQDLWQMVQENRFRADLYYRLHVFPIAIPPLRARKEDIPILVRHFVQRFAEQQNKIVDTIPDDLMTALQNYEWPGNIRELQNVIERGVIMTSGRELAQETVDRLARRPHNSPSRPFSTGGGTMTLAAAERAHITETLFETDWVVGGPNGAAARLGLARTTLLSKMQRLGISGENMKSYRGRQVQHSSRQVETPASTENAASSSDARRLETVAG